MHVAMIGAGYVGLVSGACFADFGHIVCCVDRDAAKIAALGAGRMLIYEPGLDDLVASNVRAKRLTFTGDLKAAVAAAEAVFIAVGTPSRRGDGYADLSYVYQAARDIAAALSGYTVVITKSRVPVGTGDEVERIIRETRPEADFAVVSNPEFLREGAAIAEAARPHRHRHGGCPCRAGDARTLPAAIPQPLANPADEPAHGRAHQICRERVPGDEDHLHQRDRRPVRAGRSRCPAGRAGHRA
jgi:UDPglucose 6-dehydrogenase